MDNEDRKRQACSASGSGPSSCGSGCQSLRRAGDGIYVSLDFTCIALFTGRSWLLKVHGVTIGEFRTIQEIMDFIDTWESGA